LAQTDTHASAAVFATGVCIAKARFNARATR
jgi:hypothetical protein